MAKQAPQTAQTQNKQTEENKIHKRRLYKTGTIYHKTITTHKKNKNTENVFLL